jgi:hypothetical protein
LPREHDEVTVLSTGFTGSHRNAESVARITGHVAVPTSFSIVGHVSCLYRVVPTQGRVSAQTDRKRCEIAKGSVKFRNVREEQESRRTRTERWLDNKNKPLRALGRNEQQPGRILETVNSDNKKI